MKIKPGLEAEYGEYVAKNDDPCGAAIITYGERWAELMEAAVGAEPQRIEDVADRLSYEADTERITGFMYGCAVAGLARYWQHGEQLRRWHNLKTQIGNEGEKANESGGVLNPALINIAKEPR